MKLCRKCNQTKSLDSFPPMKNRCDGRGSYCRVCMAGLMRKLYRLNPQAKKEQVEQLRQKISDEINKIKTATGCQYCSESESACLDFHHPDPTKKDGAVAHFVSAKSLKKALAEIEKCICVCSNCHRKIHAGIILS